MKKKICIFMTFIIGVAVALFSINGKNVKAETNNCTPKTNYYLLMEATSKSYYTTKFSENNGKYSRTTMKNFSLIVPEGATILKEGVLNISKTSNDSATSMSLETFHDMFLSTEDDVPYSEDGGITSYIRAISWFGEGEEESNDYTDMPTNFDSWNAQVPAVLNKPSIERFEGQTSYSLKITRTWNEDDLNNVSSGIVFSPAVYYVQYQECSGSVTINYLESETEEELKDSYVLDKKEGEQYSYTCPATVEYDDEQYILDEEEDNEFSGTVEGNIEHNCYYKKSVGYNVNVHFVDKNTKKELKESVVAESGLEDGASYQYTCKDDINYYDLVTKEQITGSVEGEDANLYCYYTKKKMTLTVDYGTDYNCSDAGVIRKSESNDYEWGTEINYTIPNIDGYEFSELGTASKKIESGVKINSKETAFTLTMPSKNASVCLVYIKNSQTGAGWIYFAWIIGVGALIYSIYYFSRYFRNEEV